MQKEGYAYEIIMVDDGSRDTSWEIVKELSEKNAYIRGISFRRNYGKSAALYHGFKAAEGRVVVTITVNPAGKVIHTSINKRTNTANAALRKAAEDAARKATFNAVGGVNNQTGTITYYFKLK